MNNFNQDAPRIVDLKGNLNSDLYKKIKEFRPNVMLHQVNGKVMSGARDVYTTVDGSGYVSGNTNLPGKNIHGEFKAKTTHRTQDDLLVSFDDGSELRLTLEESPRFWREGLDVELMLMSNDDGALPVSIRVPSTHDRVDFKNQFSTFFPKSRFIGKALPKILLYTGLMLAFLLVVLPWLYDAGFWGTAVFFGILAAIGLLFTVWLPVEFAHNKVFQELRQVPFLKPSKKL